MCILKKFSIIIFLVLLGCNYSFAQYDEVWIIGGKKKLEPTSREWKIDFALDARRSIAFDEAVKLGGLRIGIEYRRVNRFGLGFYGLNNPIDKPQSPIVDVENYSVQFDFGYISAYYERVLYYSRSWEITSTLHLGSGNVRVNYKAFQDDDWNFYDNFRVKPLEISSAATYHFSWWLSGGVGVGYRYMRDAHPELQRAYNNMVWVVKVKIRVGKAMRSVFNPDVKDEY